MATSKSVERSPIYQRPVELLQELIRFKTVNPPGDETACVNYIRDLLDTAGIETHVEAKTPERPNLIARLPGEGSAPPLLLQGHVDVVGVDNQPWRFPPFEAQIAEGFIWGRGALDMKGGVAMMVAAMLRAKAEALRPAGDVILAVLADEEGGSQSGAAFLVEEHPQYFAGVRYAIGEFGGFTLDVGGLTTYPIQVAERQVCRIGIKVHGRGVHGALAVRSGTMARAARILQRLDQERLPAHIPPTTRQMLEKVIENAPEPAAALMARLLDPAKVDQTLDAMGPLGRAFEPVFHNTANCTFVKGDLNQVELELACFILPGLTVDDFLAELKVMAGEETEITISHSGPPGQAEPDMGLFDTLAGILREADPGGLPIPYILPAISDGRHFAQLGIQNYGFIPMKLPAGFDFLATIHAADERIPVDALPFGADALYQLLRRYGNVPLS
jgi:acetylornithine deacetylase/succinyl-diaminopimelate desuccinylase-like protein